MLRQLRYLSDQLTGRRFIPHTADANRPLASRDPRKTGEPSETASHYQPGPNLWQPAFIPVQNRGDAERPRTEGGSGAGFCAFFPVSGRWRNGGLATRGSSKLKEPLLELWASFTWPASLDHNTPNCPREDCHKKRGYHNVNKPSGQLPFMLQDRPSP